MENRPLPAPHHQEFEDIGKLSAEAVMSQYENAAKSMDELAQAVRTRMENILHQCDNEIKHLADASKAIREKGKMIQEQIEKDSAISQDMHRVIDEVKSKLKV
jgi:hypothetical protein